MDYIYQQKSIRRYSILEGVFFFIEQHIKEKISLGQITEGSMISQGYLSRIFRDQFRHQHNGIYPSSQDSNGQD